MRAKVLKVKHCEAVWTNGGRIRGVCNCFQNHGGIKGGKGWVQRMLGVDFTDEESGGRFGFVAEMGGKLLGKGIGNGF